MQFYLHSCCQLPRQQTKSVKNRIVFEPENGEKKMGISKVIFVSSLVIFTHAFKNPAARGVPCVRELQHSPIFSAPKEKLNHEKVTEEKILYMVENDDPDSFDKMIDAQMEVSSGSLLLAEEEQPKQIGIWAARAILVTVAML